MSETTPAMDPEKILSIWMEWERGDETPGKVLSDLKRAGLRELLESTASSQSS